jgi:low affinity Fe/Cu permease
VILLPLFDRLQKALSFIEIMVAAWIGSWNCIFWHTVLFLLWCWSGRDFNQLTMVVSLEAIYLCIILLMAQNRIEAQNKENDEMRNEYITGLIESMVALEEIMWETLMRVDLSGQRVEKKISEIHNRKGLFL